MFSYSRWNIFGVLTSIFRNQGVAIVFENPPFEITPKYKLANIDNGSSGSLFNFIKAIENNIGKENNEANATRRCAKNMG